MGKLHWSENAVWTARKPLEFGKALLGGSEDAAWMDKEAALNAIVSKICGPKTCQMSSNRWAIEHAWEKVRGWSCFFFIVHGVLSTFRPLTPAAKQTKRSKQN